MVFSAANAVEIFIRVVVLSIGTTAIAFLAVWCGMRAARFGCAANRYLTWLSLSILCAALPIGALSSAFAHRHVSSETLVKVPVSLTVVEESAPVAYARQNEDASRTQPRVQRADTPGVIPVIEVAGALWAAGSFLLFLRIAVRLRAALTLKRGTPYRPTIPAARNAQVVFSDGVGSPVAIGYLRPAIVLPLTLSGEAFAAVREHALAHENAHLRRYDDYTALLHQLCIAIAWWNPIVWAIGSHLSAEREKACDDAVVLETRAAKEYGLSLISLCRGIRFTRTDHVLALFEARERLADRIESIVSARPRSLHPRFGAAFCCVLLASVQFIFAVAVTPGFAMAARAIQLPALPQPRAEYTTAVLQDGRVLIAGGVNAQRQYTGSVQIYDPQRHVFTPVQSMHTPRADAAAVLLEDGSVFIAGGWTAEGVTHSTEIFNPSSGTFRSGPRLNERRAEETATLLRDGRVLLTGGETSLNDPTDCSEIYDPHSGVTQFSGLMSKARAGHTATLLADGRVLISGGGSADIYDPETYAFTPAGSATN